jgi:hypothetical protein
VSTCEQKVNKEEKLTLSFHRNLLIFLGKLPLRQIISKELQWLLTEGFVSQNLARGPVPKE